MKQISALILFFFSMIANADCELKAAYDNYVEFLSSHPRLSQIRDRVAFEDFRHSVSEDSKESGIKISVQEAELRSNHLLLLSAWIDGRTVSISKYKQVCQNVSGELIASIEEKKGGKSIKVIPFTNVAGSWKRSFSFTSGYSYLLEEAGDDILKNM